MAVMTTRPYTIHVPQDDLDDLRARLHRVRWPSPVDAHSWGDGASLSFMQRLAAYWRDEFDWRAQEMRLNRLPQYMVTVDGADVHLVHRKGVGPAPLALVLTHGWPGSYVEMEHVLPLL